MSTGTGKRVLGYRAKWAGAASRGEGQEADRRAVQERAGVGGKRGDQGGVYKLQSVGVSRQSEIVPEKLTFNLTQVFSKLKSKVLTLNEFLVKQYRKSAGNLGHLLTSRVCFHRKRENLDGFDWRW